MNEPEKPDANVLYVWRAEALITWGIFLAVVIGIGIFFMYVASAPAWVLAFGALPIGFALLNLAFLKLRWERWTFQLTPFTLEMTHGWLVRHKRVVSRTRIQHVDFQSGPIGRKFDLVHVIVHTAGATVGTIPGVKSARAEQLREELMSGPKVL